MRSSRWPWSRRRLSISSSCTQLRVDCTPPWPAALEGWSWWSGLTSIAGFLAGGNNNANDSHSRVNRFFGEAGTRDPGPGTGDPGNAAAGVGWLACRSACPLLWERLQPRPVLIGPPDIREGPGIAVAAEAAPCTLCLPGPVAGWWDFPGEAARSLRQALV